ncbi:unnamed protein product [Closterium sp. NIES-54]
MAAAKRVLRYLCSTSGLGLVLGGRRPVVLTGHADASWADDQATQRSSQGYTFSLGSGSVSWRSTRSSSVLGSSCEAEIYAGAMAAQELRWLTYLLTDLGEQPRSPPVLYVDNKAMLALCREHRLEHRMKHITLRYFLARELQQRGQLRLAYVASQANTADIFTKALPPGDHQRFCTMLGFPTFTMVGAIGDAGIVDTLETRLAEARRRHEAGKYGTALPLEVVELGIQAQWVTEHPSRPASPRPVNNEGGADMGVEVGDQVGSIARGTSRQRVVFRTADGEVGGVQARGLQSSVATHPSQGNVDGCRGSMTPALATHMTAEGIAPTYGYFKFPSDKVSISRHDLLMWKESIEPQLEMAGLMCFADGSMETPPASNAELRAEFRTVQLPTFTVISRCCSPMVQIALNSCRSHLDAGHHAWQFITLTYQVTDDLYIGQLEEQMAHLQMGKQVMATDYCNRARRLLACMQMASVEYSMASYVTHVIKGLPSSYNLMKWMSMVPGTQCQNIIAYLFV